MRRSDFLTSLIGAALAGLSPRAARAAVPDATRRILWLRREGYPDEIVAPFCIDGRHVYEPGYRMICWLMRDRHVAAAQGYVQFDIVEIEALWEVQQALVLHGIYQPLVITSGYRTLQTNEAIEGAARNSMHLYAKAADMYVAGVSMRDLFNACWSREVSGGMGYYDDHVHLDSGTRRWWVGDIAVPEFSGGRTDVSVRPQVGSSGHGPACSPDASNRAALGLWHPGVLGAQRNSALCGSAVARAVPTDGLGHRPIQLPRSVAR
jgi:uncharacterized protein YcbK (DUF882 family)